MGDLSKLIVAKHLKKSPKVQKIAKSGHTGSYVSYWDSILSEPQTISLPILCLLKKAKTITNDQKFEGIAPTQLIPDSVWLINVMTTNLLFSVCTSPWMGIA